MGADGTRDGRASRDELTRLKRLTIAVGAMIVAITVGVIVIGFSTFERFIDIETSWEAFHESPETKGYHLSRIRRHLGYGGFIHLFKNFVLRRDQELAPQIEDRIGDLRKALADYETIGVSPEEKGALTLIRAVINEYEHKLGIARNMVASNYAPLLIDAQVRVDDRPAFRALATLEMLWLREREHGAARQWDVLLAGKDLIERGLLFLPLLAITALWLLWFLRKLLREIGERAERLGSVVDNVLDGIITIDEWGRVETFNAGATRIFGYTAEEVIGNNVSMLMGSPHRDRHDDYLRNYRQTGRAKVIGIGQEVEGRRRDGSIFPMELAVQEGRVLGRRFFTGIVRDITLRRQAEENLRRAKEQAELASRAKSEILANMSHELRTPLNAIIGYSETILTEIFGPLKNARYKEYINDIRSSGQHLLELITDILDVSAIEAGQMTLHEEDVDLADAIRASLRLVKPRAEAQAVTLETEIADPLPALFADRRRIKQILINLLSNAVKFTPENGSVTIAAQTSADGGLVISVTDTGIGMEEEDMTKALSQFGQVDSSMARRHEGTGLGLPLTQGLVEAHGGSLHILSAPGEGTAVTIYFPPERLAQPN